MLPETAIEIHTETELTDRFRQDCEQSFSELLERYRNRLFKDVWGFFDNCPAAYDNADDLCLETFEAAWNGRSTYGGRASFYTWLYSIARNRFIDFQRRNKADKRIPERCIDPLEGPESYGETLPASAPGPADLLDRAFWSQFLQNEISKIPKETKTRQILDMYCEGLGPSEIAERLGDTVQHVNSLKYGSVQRMKRSAKDLGWTGDER